MKISLAVLTRGNITNFNTGSNIYPEKNTVLVELHFGLSISFFHITKWYYDIVIVFSLFDMTKQRPYRAIISGAFMIITCDVGEDKINVILVSVLALQRLSCFIWLGFSILFGPIYVS